MKHKVLVRDLNTLGNQLPKHSLFRRDVHAMVLRAVEVGESHLILDDEVEVGAVMIKGIPLAKMQEQNHNNLRSQGKNG